MSKKPNIVFIFTDQQRPDTMGHADDPVAITPHLDRLANEGIVFPLCCTTAPVCMPARASLVSCKQVHEHGVWGFANPELRHGQSHVRNIRNSGYKTGIVGKTHLWRHGKGHASEHLEEMHDWGYVDAREATGPSESINTDSRYTDHLAEKGLLDLHRAYLTTYLTGQRRHVALPWELPPTNLPTEDHLDMFISGLAEEWIEDHDSTDPFYLQVNFGGPHDPWDSPAEYRRMYNADDIPLSLTEKPTGPVSPHVHSLLSNAPAKLNQMSESQNRVMKSYYYSKVTLIDDCVGRVIVALEQKGVLDDTWIVFSSDHGEMLGDHGLIAKKVFYDGAINVPCIFRPPSASGGWKSNALVGHLDIVSTLMSITGAEPLEKTAGQSLLPLLESGDSAEGANHHRDVLLSEIGIPPAGFVMVRTERYKLSVNALTREPADLYDMQEDPNELHNRVDDPQLASIRQELIDIAPRVEDMNTTEVENWNQAR